MTSTQVIEATEAFVKQELAEAEAGHDWWHIERVRNTARHLAEAEKANPYIVELGALLHDIADSKFHEGDESRGPAKAAEFLASLGVESVIIEQVKNIIENVSFRKSLDGQDFSSPELRVIQDADRLDAIGAIGIARAFNYGGYKNRAFYDPEQPPQEHQSSTIYKHSQAPTINHFYEKLLLLKDKMNTAAGRQMARERHEFMEQFLKQFYREWDGEK